MCAAFRILISCVSDEFRSYRCTLVKELTAAGREIKIQEDFTTDGGTLLEKLDRYIENSQAVLHLVGEGLGAKPKAAEIRGLLASYTDFQHVLPEVSPLLDPNNCPFSYTQWECLLAIYHRIPCYIYLAGPNSVRETAWVANSSDSVDRESYFQLLCQLGRERQSRDFVDARDIALSFLNSYFSNGGLAPAQATRNTQVWPRSVSFSDYPLADREPEFTEFRAMLSDQSPVRILMIHGPSDRGKSVLLAELFTTAKAVSGIHVAHVGFKSSLPLGDLLSDARRELTGLRFTRFDRHSTGNAPEMIRDAFLRDLQEASAPVLLLLDTFEQATEESSAWVKNRLLPLCRNDSGLRIVIAGQTVPAVDGDARLAPWVKSRELLPIHDHRPWCDFSRRVIGLTSAVPDDHIATLVTAARGSPRALSSFLANLKSAGNAI
jgi:hypothetical protein